MVSSDFPVVEIDLPRFSAARTSGGRGAELDRLYAVGGRCIVFRAFSPTFPTGINEIKQLFIILIQFRFAIFRISTKHSTSQRSSYSCDKKSTRQSDRNISHLFSTFLLCYFSRTGV
jgi:hypothetical protein